MRPLVATLDRSVKPIGALALLLLALFWLRTGTVPPASGGDEVWWSESGYQFLQGGGLRWACLDDAAGSAVRSFWPPLVPLLQAAGLALFGLTPMGMMVQSPVVATALVAATYGLARGLGLARGRALAAAVGIFGALMIEHRLVQVRMENLTALAAVGAAALILRHRHRPDGPAQRAAWFVAGVMVGLGCISYYPQGPFLLLAAAGFVFLLRPAVGAAPVVAALAGAGVVAAGFASWIAPHWPLFRQQVLVAGAEHYFSFNTLARPFLNLGGAAPLVERVQQVEKWLVLVLGLATSLRGGNAELRALGAVALAGILPMFFYAQPLPVFAGVFSVVLVFHPAFPRPGAPLARLQPWLMGWLLLAAAGNLGLAAFTAWHQRAGRDYAAVAAGLRDTIPDNARVGMSQEAWLALRGRIPAANLHLLVYAEMTLGNRPRVTRDANAADYFDYLVLRRDQLAALARTYPWLQPALDAGRFQIVRKISPDFRPLPWARVPVYDLLVYRNFRPHSAAP